MRALVIVMALIATPTLADEVTLGRSGSSNVFVWKDSDAQSEAFKLIRAKVFEAQPQLVFRLMACMVSTGTKAVITDVGFASHSVVITSGAFSGCRGVIQREDVQ